jgi:hypothetical protein
MSVLSQVAENTASTGRSLTKLDPNSRGLISCKFQGTSGTAEEKMAYEVIKLLHAMKMDTRYKKSWIIMGGEGMVSWNA